MNNWKSFSKNFMLMIKPSHYNSEKLKFKNKSFDLLARCVTSRITQFCKL